MEDDRKEQLLQRFRDYLEKAKEVTQNHDQPTEAVDLFTLFSELAALRNEVRLESRQFKSALDQFRELFSTLEDHKRKLETDLERCIDNKEKIRTNTERELLLNIIEVRDRITAGIRSMEQYRPNLLARTSRRNEQFLQSMAEGQKITLRRLDDLLTRYQVEPIQALGTMVDPHTMRVHAVEHHPERENGEVIAELTKGFRRNNDILRTAEVIVNKTETSS